MKMLAKYASYQTLSIMITIPQININFNKAKQKYL